MVTNEWKLVTTELWLKNSGVLCKHQQEFSYCNVASVTSVFQGGFWLQIILEKVGLLHYFEGL